MFYLKHFRLANFADGSSVMLPIDTNGFGGAGMGAGFIGGLVLGSLWNGNGFGFGGNRGAQIGADVALANSIEHVSDQVNQGTISGLQSTQALTNAINASTMGLNNSVTQNTISGLQSNAQLSDKLCGSTNHLMSAIDNTGDQLSAAINQSVIESMRNAQGTNDRLCAINNNITNQGYENRLQNQAIASQLAEQHAALSRQIFEENCKDRELQREIQTQALRDKLAETQASLASKEAQINLTNQLTAQTAYIIDQLRNNTTTPTTANAGA